MNYSALSKIILGIIFATAGFFLSWQFLPAQFIFLVPHFAQFLITISAGLAGIFLVPFLTKWFKILMGALGKIVAQEVIQQLKIPRVLPRRKKDKERPTYEHALVLDTSALIDGRIAEVADAGFLSGTLILPKFVLSELQRVADHPDSLKRQRGRRGFEVIDSLKKNKELKVEVIENNGAVNPKGTVDDNLISLAKYLKAKIVTNDFNLNKVASISGVRILNVNELSNALKTILLPGEEIPVKIIQAGKEKGQGVGYLEDGTMIVVEGGADFIGQEVSAKVSRVIQTVAGRMVFVRLDQATA